MNHCTNTRWNRLLALIFGWCGCLAVSPTQGETLAILATDSAGQAVVDVAVAHLSADASLQLLERAQITELIAEQNLSVLSETDPLVLGKLLGVDLFAIWQAADPESAGRVVAFDGTTGIRITDRQIEAGEFEQKVEKLVASVRQAAGKHQRLKEAKLRYVSFASPRIVDLPASLRAVGSRVIEQLEREFTQAPDVGLLERERLRFVVEESMLPIARQQGRLLSSAAIVTVQLSRSRSSKDRSIQVELLVEHPGENQPQPKIAGSVAIEADDIRLKQALAPLVQSATDRVLAHQLPQDGVARASEWQVLRTDGLRHYQTKRPYSAAVRFEAAYALSNDTEVLKLLMRSIHRSILIPTGSYIGRPRGQFDRRFAAVSESEWRDILKLGNYLQGLRIKLHERIRRESSWPFSDKYGYYLAEDFRFPYGLGSAVLVVDRRSNLHDSMRSYYEAAHRSIFGDFADHARERLSGDALQRFEAMLAEQKLRSLMEDEDGYCLVDWDQRFVDAISKCLPNDLWLYRTIWINDVIKDLNSQGRRAFDKLFSELDSIHPRSKLGLRYIRLRQQKSARGFEYSDEFEAEVRELYSDIIDQILLAAAEQRPLEDDDKVHNYAGSFRMLESVSMRGLGTLANQVLFLAPDPMIARDLYIDAFFQLAEQGVLESRILGRILRPNYLYYVPEDRDLMASVTEVAKSQRFELSDAEHEQLLKAIKTRSDRVAKPWSLKDRGYRQSHLSLPWKSNQPITLGPEEKPEIIAAQIVGDEILVAITERDRRAKLTRVKLLRVTPPFTSAAKLVGTLEITSAQIAADVQMREQVREIPTFFARYFARSFDANTIVVDEQHAYLKTAGGGILLFPLNGDQPTKIDSDWGLPSNCVQQLLPVGERLFAWVGQDDVASMFVSIDLESKQVRTIASTQRRESQTPLDNLPEAYCGLMMGTPEQDRIIMVIDGGTKPGSFEYSQRNGTWQYNIGDGTISKFQAYGFLGRAYRQTASYQMAVGRYHTQVKQKRWRLFDLDQGSFQELGPVKNVERQLPIATSADTIWWHERDKKSFFRQDRNSGAVKEFKLLPEGFANRLTIQFFPDGRSAMICTLDRLWHLTLDDPW